MAFGSGQFDHEDEVMSEINVTPLVDITLVLLIIFMITIPVLTHSVKVALPQASSPSQDQKPEHIDLVINAEGQYFWNNEALGYEALQQRLRDVAAKTPQPELHIKADRESRYDPVAQALAAAQRAGLRKVGFVMVPAR